jgi:REP element-mobilizing transposase RayT
LGSSALYSTLRVFVTLSEFRLPPKAEDPSITGTPRPVFASKKEMKTKNQLSFVAKSQKKFFGGALLAGKRKGRRPLSSTEALHLVLRSSFATGKNSFRSSRNRSAIENILGQAAKKYGVRIYRQAVQSNHIHLVIKVPHRRMYRCFISVISGKIASHAMNFTSFKIFLRSVGGEGSALAQKGQGFWDFRPFTRILNWGKDFRKCCDYVLQNTLEALGFVEYKPRKDLYSKFRLDRRRRSTA